MTKDDFLKGMIYVSAACGKSLTADAMDVYFDLLKHLTADVWLIAAKRVMSRHKFPSVPMPAEFLEAAAETQVGKIGELTAAQAWEMAWRAIANMDPELSGSIDKAMAKLPATVAETVRAMGINALCYGGEPVGVVRGQFTKAFEGIAARQKQQAILPPAVKAAIEQRAQRIGDAVPERKAIPAGRAEAIVGNLADRFAIGADA